MWANWQALIGTVSALMFSHNEFTKNETTLSYIINNVLIAQNRYKLQEDHFCLTGKTAVNYQHLSTSWFQSYNIWLPEY